MTTVDKKSLTERDICTKFITPAIEAAGWDVMTQMREQVYFTKGRVIVRGKTVKRGEAKFADYILYHKPNLPIAVVEAKDNNQAIGAGMQQALDYANTLDIPFVFSSNGDGFLEHDRTRSATPLERELALDGFTIMDFRKATELFADPDFDGDPVQIYVPGSDDPPIPPDDENDPPPIILVDPAEPNPIPGPEPPPGPGGRRVKYVVDDVPVWVVAERVQYYGVDGKLITESLKDYTRKAVRQDFSSLDEFLSRWNGAERKQAIIDELEEQGVLLHALADEVGKNFDPFDLICHIAFDQPPLTRRERADNVRKRDYFSKHGERARAVLDALLEKYADEGIEHVEDIGVLKVQPINQFGTPVEIVNLFGGKEQYVEAVQQLQLLLYETAA